ncbi:MAG: GNAT family N-acetyltransferase [Pseudobacteriovorax sp.]|nr:GNAT family N-acetyltransferase [Pseudobacteriovorax sp.]
MLKWELAKSEGNGRRLKSQYRAPQGRSLPRLECRLTSHKNHFRVWLEKLSYEFIHLKIHQNHDFRLGQEYRLQFKLGTKWIKCVTRVAYIDDKNHKLGLRFTQCPERLRRFLGQIYFNKNQISPQNLREKGFPVESAKQGVIYKVLSKTREFEQVLRLRKDCYSKAGKLSNKVETMADVFDQRSVIVIAIHHDEVVGSLRLIFSNKNQLMEHEGETTIPFYFPEKDNIIEITRVCTSPYYRKSDLLEGMFEFTAHTAMLHPRSFILGSATKELLPIYRKLGFTEHGGFYENKTLGNSQHRLILAEKKDLIFGKKVHPYVWYSIYREVYQYAYSGGMVHPQPIRTKIKLMLISLLGLGFKQIKIWQIRSKTRNTRPKKRNLR